MSCAADSKFSCRPRTKEIIDPTYPLLEANRSAIESIRRETFTYSSSDVHNLDVYYPPLPGSDGLPPILVFFYGGGLGILVVIPDYRLVPGITFPQGSKTLLLQFGRVRGCRIDGAPCEILPSRPQFYAIAQLYYEVLKSGGSEPRAISTSMRTFAREYRKRGGTVDEFVLEGHDHLSPILALSSGSGEGWGYDVVRWIMGTKRQIQWTRATMKNVE
ncbi:hypothetical protein EDC04DRAFT_3096472 [Pisolithus marmoratus]|nr:hypothetical protein EDC04DRAFT_3096472 [Pisolithus marmoratus]